jgi:hypothetical protein
MTKRKTATAAKKAASRSGLVRDRADEETRSQQSGFCFNNSM